MATFLRGSLEEQERARGAGRLRRAVVRAVERVAVVESDVVIAVSRELAARARRGAIVLPNDAHVPGTACLPEPARQELGLPCLGARSGGIQEMLVDEALLFPTGDAAARLSELRDEPQERERLVSLARARAATYDFDGDERAAAILEASFWGEDRVAPR